jgi:radical SAM-linked protein
MAQYICRYRKGEPLRWIGHLDLKRTLERALRRARLPLELTQGHNPHPKMSFGPPLPLGATGEAEVFSLHLTEPLTAEALIERLRAQLPAGFDTTDVWTVPGYKKRETFGDINIADYRVVVATELSLAEIHARVRDLLAREEIIVERGGERPERAVDLRPMILTLWAESRGEDEVELIMKLRTGSHGGARPQEVVTLLGLDPSDRATRICRTALGAEGEPLPERPKPGLRRHWGSTRRR